MNALLQKPPLLACRGRLGIAALLLFACLVLPAWAAAPFAVNANGTVSDSNTGLVWDQCPYGLSGGNCATGTAFYGTWPGALAAAVAANAAHYKGFSDWRVPNKKELESIVSLDSYTDGVPAIDTAAFPGAPAYWFWTSTTYAPNPGGAWIVVFVNGDADASYKADSGCVRLVRSGQSFASFDSLAGASSLNVAPGWNLLGNSLSQPLPMAPAFSDPALVNTVWKWDVSRSGWQFFTPSMDATALQTYVTAKGYGVLSVINPGEGFWVNAKLAGILVNQSGAAFALTAALQPGWNLVATGYDVSPSGFNLSLSTPPPAAGTIPLNLTSLWAWDNPASKWYFYSPALEASGGLGAYTAGKGYLDFTATGKTLGNGVGFWVNKL